MTVFGAVFARGGSKGVAGKNLRKIAGTSLLELSVGMGLKTVAIDRVLCSTDSDEIAAEATRLGAEVPFLRPENLSGDNSPEWGAWQHLAQFLIDGGASESDVLVSLPTTSPLRALEDVVDALELFEGGTFDLVLGVSEAARSPWFNMVTRAANAEVRLVANTEGGPVTRRQDAPAAFDVTTVVYVTTLGFVLRSRGLFEGSVGSVLIPRERAIDVDTALDLEFADHLIRKRIGLTGG